LARDGVLLCLDLLKFLALLAVGWYLTDHLEGPEKQLSLWSP